MKMDVWILAWPFILMGWLDLNAILSFAFLVPRVKGSAYICESTILLERFRCRDISFARGL
jgi:hypothetical protein